MKNKCYFFFPPMQYIAIDAAIPLVVTLAKKGWKVYSVFYSLHTEEQYYTQTYMDVIKEHSVIIDLKITKLKSWQKPVRLSYYVWFLIKSIFRPKVRFITMLPAKDILGKLLKILSRFNQIYCMSKVPAPLHKEYYESYFVNALNDQNIRVNILGKSTGNYDAYQKKDYIGKYLISSEYENQMSDIVGYPDDRLIIGYPKIFPTWLEYVADYHVNWTNKLLDKNQKIITILLLSKDVYFYNQDDSVDILLTEIIEKIRTYYKDDIIVIKDKPRAGNSANHWLTDYVASLSDENVVISSVPTPFLAQKSKLMVMAGDTTSCFDYIIREVPSIEHARYSDDTLKWYPEISGWGKYNITRTSSVDELNSAISDIHTGNFKPMSVSQVKKIISHTDDESFIEEL